MGGQTTTVSISQVISTLIPIGLIAICGVTAFLVLRKKHLRIYQPRTFLTSLRPQERTPQFSDKGLFSWIPEYLKMPDSFVLNHQSMDAYFLLRFLRIGTLICLIGCCITWPILWPVYATAGGGATQFDLLSLSNVTGKNNPRLYAATFVAWVFFAFVWYMIAREQIYYINLRQAYLLSPLYANRISSKTVLYNSVPLEYCDEAVIRQLFKATPPKNVWISTDTKELTDLVDERRKAILQLEGAETKLIKTANDNRLKALKKNPQSVEEEQAQATADVDGESGSAAGRWVKPSERPTHKLKMLIGKKVDSINWCREEIARLTPLIEKSQAEHRSGSAKAVGAVFVEFNSQAEAQSAFQSTTHHQALKMTPRFVGCTPEDIIWSNLRIKWWERLLRKLGTNTFVVLLLLFWAIPVAIVGLISNIYAVLPPSCAGPTATGPSWMAWLCFITKLPSVLFGLIQGLLPSVLLAVLMALVPIILRLMAKLGGAPTLSSVELSTQSTYFAFQIIETFLVTTIGSSASAVASQIGQNPGSTPTLLAKNIPKAANIYMSYVIVVALSFFWSYLLQIAGLVLFYLLGKFLDNTPRKMYTRWMSLSGIGWGSLFPMYEFLVVICIIYSCWAPLLLGWSTIGLYLIYQAFRHNFFFVTNATIDTKGLVYPRALNHLTVGLYVAEVCYVGIFAVSEAPGPTVLMVIFLIVSILYHMTLNKALGPLLATLPTSLTVEEDRLQRLENSNVQTSNGHSNGNGNVNNSVSTAVDGKDKISSDGELQHRTSLPPAHKKPNFVSKWLRPDRYADYETLRRLVPHNFADIDYSAEIERESYYDPAIRDEAGLVWIPRDTMGISRQEVAHSGKVITTTDESSFLDDEGKIQWNKDELPPVYEEKIYY